MFPRASLRERLDKSVITTAWVIHRMHLRLRSRGLLFFPMHPLVRVCGRPDLNPAKELNHFR